MENPTQRQAGVAGCGLGWIRTHNHRRSPVGGQGCGTGGRTVVDSSGKCRMRTTALNAHPPCAEDTGRAGAQAPGVRVLCRNPYSRSQRTPRPAPPPAQSRRRKAGGRKGRRTPPGSSSSRSRGPPAAQPRPTARAAGHPTFTVGSTSPSPLQLVAAPAGARGVEEDVVELHEDEVVELHEEEVVAGGARCCCAPRSTADAREVP